MKLISTFSIIIFVLANYQINVSAEDALSPLKLKPGEEAANDVRTLNAEVLIYKSEKNAIRQLKKLINKYKNQPFEADLQFRLAELYMRRAKADDVLEYTKSSEHLLELTTKLAKSSSEKKNVERAITVYKYLEIKFPKYSKRDQVYFNHAMAEKRLSHNFLTKSILEKLITLYPNSNWIPEAHLTLGEMLFKQKQYSKAMTHFKSAVQYPSARTYNYGLYKMAWTYYNLQNTPKAMETLESLILRSHLEAEVPKISLRKEAESDLILFFSESQNPKNAYKYFNKYVSHQELPGVLYELSKIYQRNSEYIKAEIVVRNSIDKFNDSNPDFGIKNYSLLLNILEQSRNRTQLLSELVSFQAECKQYSLPTKEYCFSELHQASVRLAKKWLAIWNKNPSHSEFAKHSLLAFQFYADNNSDQNEVAEAHFFRGNILFNLKKYKQASEEYLLSSEGYKDRESVHKSLYSAIVSYEKFANPSNWKKEEIQKYEILAETYKKKFPHGKYNFDIQFKLGSLFYDSKNYQRSQDVFQNLNHLSDTVGKSKKHIQAENMYMDSLQNLGRYEELENYTQKLLKESARSQNNLKRISFLKEVYSQSFFLKIQKIEKQGDRLKARDLYLDYAKKENGPFAEKALLNALSIAQNMSQISWVNRTLFSYWNKLKNSAVQKELLIQSVENYKKLGDLKGAIFSLEKLSQVDLGQSNQWMYLQADLLSLNGEIALSTKIYKSLLKSAPQYRERVLIKLWKLEEPQRSHDFWAYNHQLLTSPNLEIQSQAHLYQLQNLFESHKYEAAFQWAKHMVAMSGKYPQDTLAEARYIQAQILDQEFLHQSLKSSVEKFELVFSIKSEKFEKAQKAYLAVIKFQSKTTFKALVSLATLYYQYSQELKKIPIPRGLKDEEVKAFHEQFAQINQPLLEKASESLKQAFQWANQQKALGETLVKAQNLWKQMNPSDPRENLPLVAPSPQLPMFYEVKS